MTVSDNGAGELEALRRLSATLGDDLALIQGAGGNTSLKIGDTLWIKASGTWLARARDRDIMVPVEMHPLLDAVHAVDPAAEKAEQFIIAAQAPPGLRPSIETTVHALMPQRVVLHVHCVNTIAIAVRKDAEGLLEPRLRGVNWALVPYARPGLPLAHAIQSVSGNRPDILILANHGLVVAAQTVDAAAVLLNDVVERLASRPRTFAEPRIERLQALASDTANLAYRLPRTPEAHGIATDEISIAHARQGSLYPDHVIFLEEGAPVAGAGETPAEVAARLGKAPPFIVFPGLGVLMREDVPLNGDLMVQCLADVAARIPAGAPLRVLSAREHLDLTDWDAEKYRQELARATSSAEARVP
ncbi:class II aldolase/adducin family protein [Labrenzia sp. 011]|uniref:class II aldolase/adducin family protein n=1 Tax=Labrenzia sp. 011 TaxID=2171494 RepID=UPI000D517151|nr:class II aldolase/adducin family protein [Labrenzia sp. 011]PVB62854.1 class II aldolase [Labrenzia sp. 011]